MKLTATDISSRLAACFGGTLLFQPVSMTEGEAQRPVAMLASVAQMIPQGVRPATGVSLRNPLFDLLHHDPATAVRHKR